MPAWLSDSLALCLYNPFRSTLYGALIAKFSRSWICDLGVVDSRSRASIFEKRPRKFGDRGAKRAREMILVRLIAAMSFPVLELNFSVSPGRGEKRNLKGI